MSEKNLRFSSVFSEWLENNIAHNRGEVRILLTRKKHSFLGEESVSVSYVSKSQSIVLKTLSNK